MTRLASSSGSTSAAPGIVLCGDCHEIIWRLQQSVSRINTDKINNLEPLGYNYVAVLKRSVQELEQSAKRCRSCSFFLTHSHSMIQRNAKSWYPSDKISFKLDFSSQQQDDNIFKLVVGHGEKRLFTFFTSHGIVVLGVPVRDSVD